MGKKKKGQSDSQIAVSNRKARHDYEIVESMEAGIALLGSEVKALREGKGALRDAYAQDKDEELYLYGFSIQPYKQAGKFNHAPDRVKKLLLHRRQIDKLLGKIRTKGLTLVPLSVYFNERGVAKVDLAIAKGKAKYDKREAEKQRDWQREKARMMRDS